MTILTFNSMFLFLSVFQILNMLGEQLVPLIGTLGVNTASVYNGTGQ